MFYLNKPSTTGMESVFNSILYKDYAFDLSYVAVKGSFLNVDKCQILERIAEVMPRFVPIVVNCKVST